MCFRLVPKRVTLGDLERRIQGLPQVFTFARLSQERVKLRTSSFAGRPTFIMVHPNNRPLKILGKMKRGRIQGSTTLLRRPVSEAGGPSQRPKRC